MRQTACDLCGTKTVVEDFLIFYNELGYFAGRLIEECYVSVFR